MLDDLITSQPPQSTGYSLLTHLIDCCGRRSLILEIGDMETGGKNQDHNLPRASCIYLHCILEIAGKSSGITLTPSFDQAAGRKSCMYHA